MPNDGDILERLTAEWEPRLRKAFLDAVQDIVLSVPIADLVELIEAGNIEAAVHLIGINPDDFIRVDAVLTQVFEAGGAAIVESIPISRRASRLRIGFDVRNMRAENWIRTRSAKLVGEIVAEQRDVIRSHLVNGLAQGINPREMALDLVGRINSATGARTGGIIGLTSEQEKWVRNYAQELRSSSPADLHKAMKRAMRNRSYDRTIAKAIREGTTLPKEIQQVLLRHYNNKALLYRAENIARTEAMTALGEAQDQAYRQAISKGAVDEAAVKRFWHTAADERVRATHRLIPSMNKEGRRIDEPFATPDGPAMRAPFGINCRCYVRFRVDFLAGVK